MYMRIAVLCTLLAACSRPAGAVDYFTIQVVDQATGHGVPLIELSTVNNVRYYTDSAGIVAFHEPGLMNQRVFFHVKSHGYEYPKDRFGFRGACLQVVPGGKATLKIARINIAQRLYRMTGAGIYRDSLLVGSPVPTEKPLLNSQVLGSDSVVNTIYRGKIYWFWGDTNQPSYPLGNFHVPGATSPLPEDGGLAPEVGVNLDYFVDETGFAKATCNMPGKGPTWISGLVALKAPYGDERLFASYVKIKPPLTVYERGLAKFDDETQQFQKLIEFDVQSPLFPDGHPVIHDDGSGGYVYFAHPFPVVRVRATPDHLCDLSKYEAYTCLKQGSRADSIQIDRQDGIPHFSWKTDTPAFTPKLQTSLIKTGHIKPEETPFQLTEDTGKPIVMHGGSVYWNEYRKRWILIGVQSAGTSMLGEVWLAEAEQLVGPWRSAHKIVTHDRYSFYNPKQHPMLDQDGGRLIYFEGTYTSMFSGNDDQTPRYNYNQILYQLDLSDPRLR